MNVETFLYVWEGTIVTISLLLLGWFIIDNLFKRDAKRRAGELLRVVLTQEQSCQLIQRGYIDIPSPSDPQRVYRVPRTPGFVQVREKGRLKVKLCLQPIGWVPDADIVAIHKLMIEADEESYLQKANVIGPMWAQ
jgi:hypothetical protein